MIKLNTQQGSLEWLMARLWRLTASDMKGLILTSGKLSASKTAIKKIDKLIAGIKLANKLNTMSDELINMDDYELQKFMANYNGEKFSGNLHTERGHDQEATALALLSERIGKQINEVGMVLMGDNENSVVSCSPDGEISEDVKMIAGAEVKAPCLNNYYRYVVEDVLPDDYKIQVHASMAICGVDTWHFAAYFEGEPLFYKEVNRDAFTDTIEQSLNDFRAMYEERYHVVTLAVSLLENQEMGGIQ